TAALLLSVASVGNFATRAEAAETVEATQGWNPYNISIPTTTEKVSTYYQIATRTGSDATQLYKATFDNGSYKQTAVGSPVSFTYNGIAIDPQTSAMYAAVVKAPSGAKDSAGNPVQTDDFLYVNRTNGKIYDMGTPTGMTHTESFGGFNVAGASNGKLYMTNSGTTSSAGRQQLWTVDLSTGTATSTNLTAGIVMSSDWTYENGFLWGRADANGDLLRVNPSNGQIKSFTLPSNMPSGGNQGGVFTFGNGNLGLVLNHGVTVQLSIGNPENPQPKVIATYKTAPGAGTDGASLIVGPVDLSIQKTADAVTVSPEGLVTWTLKITNESDIPSSGWVVKDDVPEGYTDVKVVDGSGTVEGNQVVFTGGQLDPHESVQVKLSAKAPNTTIEECMVNTADVNGNEDDPNPDNDSDNAKTCDEPGTVVWKKTDEQKKALAGSSWKLSGPNGYSLSITDNDVNDTDKSDGVFNVKGLQWGAYTLKETKAPVGHFIDQTEHAFTVKADTLTIDLDDIINNTMKPGLKVVKTSEPTSGSTVKPGQTVTYKIKATNTGNTVLDPAEVKDDLSGVFDNATYIDGSAKSTAGKAPSVNVSENNLSWSGRIEKGESVTLSYQVKVNENASDGAKLANLVIASGTNPDNPDTPVPSNCTADTAKSDPDCNTVNPIVNPPSGPSVHTGGTVTKADDDGYLIAGGLAVLGLIGTGVAVTLLLKRRSSEQL
ncbi:DUF6923 family protein, partial [Bifidobacterium psychraerophilum]